MDQITAEQIINQARKYPPGISGRRPGPVHARPGLTRLVAAPGHPCPGLTRPIFIGRVNKPAMGAPPDPPFRSHNSSGIPASHHPLLPASLIPLHQLFGMRGHSSGCSSHRDTLLTDPFWRRSYMCGIQSQSGEREPANQISHNGRNLIPDKVIHDRKLSAHDQT